MKCKVKLYVQGLHELICINYLFVSECNYIPVYPWIKCKHTKPLTNIHVYVYLHTDIQIRLGLPKCMG